MKPVLSGSVFIIFLILEGCVEKFIPEIPQSPYKIVANGLITNQPEVDTIRLSWTIPVGEKTSVPMQGCEVAVYDDLGHVYQFCESSTPGIYISDPTTFQGVVGRTYTLHINSKNATPKHYSYESLPVEMKAVPPIDSLYYEKVLIKERTYYTGPQEGCQIYLNTYDPDRNCRFFRWDYTETWQFEIVFDKFPVNRNCWISNNATNINIKSTSGLSENRITRFPLLFISNKTDRLSIRYSILVNQYSLSENEFFYWDEIRNITDNTGGLYGIIPSSVNGNLFCVEDPNEQVLGYFSVSAKTSKRIYVDESFRGLENIYVPECLDLPIEYAPSYGQNEWWWIIVYDGMWVTYKKWCADCTTRGTLTRPEFWEDPD